MIHWLVSTWQAMPHEVQGCFILLPSLLLMLACMYELLAEAERTHGG